MTPPTTLRGFCNIHSSSPEGLKLPECTKPSDAPVQRSRYLMVDLAQCWGGQRDTLEPCGPRGHVRGWLGDL